jgi:hypothetical protein
MRVFACEQKKVREREGRDIGREREREGVMRIERVRVGGREIKKKRDREGEIK